MERLRHGDSPTTEEERLLVRMYDLAQSALRVPPNSDTAEVYLNHLQQVQEQAEKEGKPEVALLMGGATKIKQYVFESSKLPEIRGASALLDRINLVDLPALFKRPIQDVRYQDHVDTVHARFREKFDLQPLGCSDCIIYANGGEFFAFAPVSIAQKLADAIEWLYTSETLVANSVSVWKPFSLVELAGGINALEFWQNWQQEERLAILTSLLGQRATATLPAKKRFGELAATLALEKFRRREGNPSLEDHMTRLPKSTAHWETVKYGERCRSCEYRVASQSFPLVGEQQPVCEPCYRKLHEGWTLKRGWADEFEKFLMITNQDSSYYTIPDKGQSRDIRTECERREWDGATYPDRPKDLNEIGQASNPQGYIGVVYADGNNMGAILEQLQTPDAYSSFAKTVYDATQAEVFTALATHLQPKQVERERGDASHERLWIHPFEILSIGGDDLFLIVPAHQALSMAIKIAQQVEHQLSQNDLFASTAAYDPKLHRSYREDQDTPPSVTQSRVGLSAGVLLADAKTPIFFLQDLVNQLLKSAKRRAKSLRKHNYLGGTIDFMALKSVTMITSALQEFRDSTLRVNTASLTARPYTLVEMQHLLETVRALKAVDFPRSQLYALRNALSKGRVASTVNYLYFTERLDVQHHKQMRDVLDDRWCQAGMAPWRHTDQQGWETVLLDVLEIYDFVEAKA